MSGEPPDDTWLERAEADGWHMSAVTIPERPDDREWRKSLALRLLPLGALGVMALCAVFLKPAIELIVANVLIGAVTAVEAYVHFRRRPS
jgi:hypothetical protein